MIGTWIKSVVQFHNALHRFCAGSRTGTSIMEIKLEQELASVYQYPLVLVLLYIWKAYKNLDRR